VSVARHGSIAAVALAGLMLAGGGAIAGGAVQNPSWLGPMAGARLVAVDGSTLTVAPTEGGFVVALNAADGGAQHTAFAYIGERLGTISDASDPGRVTGFFRQTDNGLEIQFADGRAETLALNSAGGFSLTLRAADGAASCSAWYPQGHVFGAAEKRAALAVYAHKLGIAEHAKRTARTPISDCPAAVKSATHLPSPAQPAPYRIGMYAGAEVTTPGAAAPAIAVRTSNVQPVDPPVPAQPAASPPPVAQAPTAAAPAVPSDATKVTLASAMPDGHGASDCLSVESANGTIGFRNRCGFGVQFAYCLQRATDAAADCGGVAKMGAVAANGFALLLESVDSREPERDFRWVACSGSNGNVVAHLDRADPPSGRCERLNAS